MKPEYLMYLIILALIVSSGLTVVVSRYIEGDRKRDETGGKTIWRWNPIYTIQLLVKNRELTTKEKLLLCIPLFMFIVAIVLTFIYNRQV